MFNSSKGNRSLRLGRSSVPACRYFVTFNVLAGSPSLASSGIYPLIENAVSNGENEGVFSEVSFVVMPDHLHLLFRLGERLSLGKAISRLKSEVKRSSGDAGLAWQTGFFDRKLRLDESDYPVLHYMYLNPYRAGLIGVDGKWAFCRFSEEAWDLFKEGLDGECPYPEWLESGD